MVVMFKDLPKANGTVQFVLDANIGKAVDVSIHDNLRHVGKGRTKDCPRLQYFVIRIERIR